jgi:hypothetical protein
MELKLRFIFIISCWPGGPTSYRITRGPDWGYLGADKFERGLSQVPGPTRIRPDLLQRVLNSLWLGIDTQLLRRNKAIDYILT